jgi:hypothetical protein
VTVPAVAARGESSSAAARSQFTIAARITVSDSRYRGDTARHQSSTGNQNISFIDASLRPASSSMPVRDHSPDTQEV